MKSTATVRRGRVERALVAFAVQIYPRMLGALLIFTAWQKALDGSGVARVLAFDRVPDSLIGVVTQLIMCIEAFLGFVLIIRPTIRPVLLCSAGLLGVYTIQLAYLAALQDAPGCNCLGAWESYASARTQNLIGITRNVVLILPLLWAWRVSRAAGRIPTPIDHGCQASHLPRP